MVDFWKKHDEFVREMNEQDNEQSKWAREKLKSFLKTVLKALNMQFSRLKWVVNKSPKTPETKFEKFIQVFFATRRSTRKEVAKGAAKHSEYISRLELSLENKSPN